MTPSELSNDRHVIDWLGVLTLATIGSALACGLAHGPAALTGSLATLAIQGATAIGVRRTRAGTPMDDAPTPPPWTGVIAGHDRIENP